MAKCTEETAPVMAFEVLDDLHENAKQQIERIIKQVLRRNGCIATSWITTTTTTTSTASNLSTSTPYITRISITITNTIDTPTPTTKTTTTYSSSTYTSTTNITHIASTIT